MAHKKLSNIICGFFFLCMYFYIKKLNDKEELIQKHFQTKFFVADGHKPMQSQN